MLDEICKLPDYTRASKKTSYLFGSEEFILGVDLLAALQRKTMDHAGC